MKIKPYGDQALLVEFEQQMELAISQKVIALNELLENNKNIKYLIPAYHTLTIGLKESANLTEVYSAIQAIDFDVAKPSNKQEVTIIPTCYEAPFSPDIEEVKTLTGLSKEEIIHLHTTKTYHVFMLGFLAGFAYMGQTDHKLYVSRKNQPRLKVSKGAVGLAGNQTGIYPTEAPGGWQIIGTTPMHLFDPNSTPPALLKPGAKVRFRAISADEFKLIEIKISTGIYRTEKSYV